MTTTTTAPVAPAIGATARFDLANGDQYMGEVVAAAADIVVLRNYSAWYEGDPEPFNSEHFDDEVRFRVDRHTRVETF